MWPFRARSRLGDPPSPVGEQMSAIRRDARLLGVRTAMAPRRRG